MATPKSKTQSELSKTDVKIVIIVVMVIITILGCVAEGVFLLKPKIEERDKAIQTLDALQPRVEEAKRVPDKIQELRDKISILEGKTTDTESEENSELLEKIDIPKILTIVENSATNAKLNFKSVSMDGNAAYVKGGIIEGELPATPNGEGEAPLETPEQNASSFFKLGISMEVTSVTYDGLVKFLANVENAGYYITTSSASLTSVDGGKTYSGSLTFHIYSFVATT